MENNALFVEDCGTTNKSFVEGAWPASIAFNAESLASSQNGAILQIVNDSVDDVDPLQ